MISLDLLIYSAIRMFFQVFNKLFISILIRLLELAMHGNKTKANNGKLRNKKNNSKFKINKTNKYKVSNPIKRLKKIDYDILVVIN